MANPFLYMEEVSASNVADNSEFDNPFLVDDDDDEIDMLEAGEKIENPFSASNPFAFTADDTNVVATTTASDMVGSDTVTQTNASLFLVDDDDDGDELTLPQQQEEEQHDPAMAFFGTTIEENDDIHDETQNKTVRPLQPSQDTKQMISNLTDHLDATSHSLLGKIPVTRSPSPVSMRDLDSPAPDVDDLLDVSDAFSTGTTKQQAEAPKPNRPPPPARPIPPRPTPPKQSPVTEPTTSITNTVTQAKAQQKQEDDLLSFGPPQQKKQPPPKPSAPKTKDDILSLYSADLEPTQQQQDSPHDLLSEDIDFTQETKVTGEKSKSPEESSPSLVVNHHHNIPTIEMHLTTEDNVMDQYSPEYIEPKEIAQEIGNHHEDVDMNFAPAEFTTSVEENPFSTPSIALTPPEQDEKLKLLQEKPVEYQAPRPTTPDPIVAQPELAPIFGDIIPAQTQISPSKVAPPPPVRGGSVLTTVQQSVPRQQQLQNHNTNAFSSTTSEMQGSDEFDDFSVKFETAQTKTTGNIFLDSIGATSPAATDAWGDTSRFVVSADDGFGNEDGFDSWDPPAVPESTPYMHRRASRDSDEERDLKVVIKPKTNAEFATAPAIAPPVAKSPYLGGSIYSEGVY
jgi:stonin-1/2